MGKEKKTDLVIITECFPVKDFVSAGEFVLQQILELAKNNYNITILYPRALFPSVYKFIEKCKGKSFYSPEKPELQLPDNVKYYFVPYLYYTKFGLKDFLKTFGLYAFIKLKGIKVDLIHAHMAYNSGYLATLLGGWLKKPVVITTHGDDINCLFPHGPEISNSYWNEDVKGKILKALQNSNKIIAVSNDLRNRILKQNISDEKIRVIYNGIYLSIFNLGSQIQARTNLGLPKDKKILLFVGSIILRKGIVDLIDAIESIKVTHNNMLCVIIGQGDLEDKLKERIKANKLEQNVLIAGQIENSQLPQWFIASDVFCVPSISEAFGCVFVEAIACGRPVVATNVGGIPEIINQPELGILVPPKDPEKLAEALLYALNKQWDEQVIHKSAERFFWPQITPQIEAVYNEVLGQANSPPN